MGRVHARLLRQGETCSVELVRALMCELDLYPCQPRSFRSITTLPATAAARPACKASITGLVFMWSAIA